MGPSSLAREVALARLRRTGAGFQAPTGMLPVVLEQGSRPAGDGPHAPHAPPATALPALASAREGAAVDGGGSAAPSGVVALPTAVAASAPGTKGRRTKGKGKSSKRQAAKGRKHKTRKHGGDSGVRERVPSSPKSAFRPGQWTLRGDSSSEDSGDSDVDSEAALDAPVHLTPLSRSVLPARLGPSLPNLVLPPPGGSAERHPYALRAGSLSERRSVRVPSVAGAASASSALTARGAQPPRLQLPVAPGDEGALGTITPTGGANPELPAMVTARDVATLALHAGYGSRGRGRRPLQQERIGGPPPRAGRGSRPMGGEEEEEEEPGTPDEEVIRAMTPLDVSMVQQLGLGRVVPGFGRSLYPSQQRAVGRSHRAAASALVK